jgi:hypothetical protein
MTESEPTDTEIELRRQEEERKAQEEQKAQEQKIAQAEKKAQEEKIAQEARAAAEKAFAEKAAAEQRLAEEIERRRIAEEEERHRVAEEERRRMAEEEALRKKAEEEIAQKKKEEEERQERIKKEVEERQRRHEEQLRLQRLEIERQRREALPIVLCQCALMLDSDDPKVRCDKWLSKFLPLFTVTTSQLDTNVASSVPDELWIPNYQAAALLTTKDLRLRNYTAIEKRPATLAHRQRLWAVSRFMLSYEYETNGMNTSIEQAKQIEERERPKFYAMTEVFWVKLSDFQDQVFRHPHLASLQLKQQAISLRIFGPRTPAGGSPPGNTVLQNSPKLTNGTSPLVQQSNGYTRL